MLLVREFNSSVVGTTRLFRNLINAPAVPTGSLGESDRHERTGAW
jgi:hypothetical protein